MLNLGGSQKAIYFWTKKGKIQWQKRVQFNTNRIKKVTPLGLGPKKGTQQLMYVVQN